MSASFEHEKALRTLDITAEVIHDGTDRLLVGLSVDSLDRLIDAAIEAWTMEEKLDEAESAAHEVGYTAGQEYGYEEACSDIKAETGAAWTIVGPMIENAREAGHEAGYEDALDDIASLA